MVTTDTRYLSIVEAASLLREGGATPTTLTEESFQRIDAIDPHINSYITLTRERAFEQARRAEEDFKKGVDRGPLQGVPIALKDLYGTKGVRTTAHSKVLVDWLPEDDAT